MARPTLTPAHSPSPAAQRRTDLLDGVIRPHWRATPERRRAELHLGCMLQADEVRAELERMEPCPIVREALGLYRVLLPVQRRLQTKLETDLARSEGRTPPGGGGASARPPKAA